MSNADTKEEVPVESSRFGKRFGRIFAIILVLIAALVAIVTFSGGSSQSPSESIQSDNPFK